MADPQTPAPTSTPPLYDPARLRLRASDLDALLSDVPSTIGNEQPKYGAAHVPASAPNEMWSIDFVSDAHCSMAGGGER